MTNLADLMRSTSPATLSERVRSTHCYSIGQPGVGKSRVFESWIMQDIAAGHGVAVLDPHGDLYQHVLSRTALLLYKQPDLAERVILIDPTIREWTVCFNPLEAVQGYSPARLASFLTDVVLKIWKLDASSAPRMVRLLAFSFQALAELNLPLGALPRFLYDKDMRAEHLQRARNRDVVDFFEFEFPKSPAAAQQWAAPVLNKIGALLFDPDMRLMFSTKSTINFRQVLDKNLVLLVNLSKGVLGEENSSLLGAFLVAHLQKAALSRADGQHRSPYYLYLDEFQNYTTDNIQDILSESRKYGLSLILAHQYLDQLAAPLRSAVLNTTGTIAAFRIGYQDATVLAHEIFPPGFGARSQHDVEWLRMGQLQIPYLKDNVTVPSLADQVHRLTDLKPREFWVRIRGASRPFKLRALDMPDPVMTDEAYEVRNQLCALSGRLYGRLKSDLRKEIDSERDYRRSKPIADYEDA